MKTKPVKSAIYKCLAAIAICGGAYLGIKGYGDFRYRQGIVDTLPRAVQITEQPGEKHCLVHTKNGVGTSLERMILEPSASPNTTTTLYWTDK